MNNVYQLAPQGEAQHENLAEAIQECVSRAAEQVGQAGVIAFFNGYKDSVDSLLVAA